jgi:hypothetical protein
MVKFEISESLNFRGGNHYCFVYADDANEVINELKDAWYSSGIHRNGGELFLSAYIKNFDNKEIELFCGNCSVDGDEDLYSSFSFPNDKRDRDIWHSLGFFLEDSEGDSFEEVLKVFFEFDVPDRVLGSYLFKLQKIMADLKPEEKANFGANVLANILDFGGKQNKSKELYAWLISDEGTEYLDSNSNFEITANAVFATLRNIEITNIEKFIVQYKRDFATGIFLPSTRT